MTANELAAVLREAGPRHHQAYITSDGADPEWPLWYAGYLQTRLWDNLGRLPSRSELVHLLIECDQAFQADDTATDWPPFYAERFLQHFAS